MNWAQCISEIRSWEKPLCFGKLFPFDAYEVSCRARAEELPYAGYPVIRPLKIGSPVPVHPDGIQQTAALLKQKALHTIDNCPTIIQFGEKRKPRNALGGNNMNQRVIYINTCSS
jgi:hypothetical protein